MGYRLLGLLSLFGLVFSAVCHLMAWMGLPPPGGLATFAGLHVGIFVLWFPLVILATRTMPKQPDEKSAGAKGSKKREAKSKGSSRGNLDHLFKALPAWVEKAMGALFVYALANFLLFAIQTSQYSKHDVPRALQLRGFSGHWMVFYGMATAGFFGLARYTRKPKEPGPGTPKRESGDRGFGW